MEEVLDEYERECPENTVRLSFDERPCQLIGEVYAPMKMKPGKVHKYDCEYERKGSGCLLMAYDIDKGKRYAQVRERRTKKDFAEYFDWLEKQYVDADHIIVILDNLNTHHAGTFYEYLTLSRATELRKKIKFLYTPKHGSWLNMIELEFSALSRQCLDRRISSLDQLRDQILHWIKDRNDKKIKIDWTFTSKKAQKKMGSKYQRISDNN